MVLCRAVRGADLAVVGVASQEDVEGDPDGGVLGTDEPGDCPRPGQHWHLVECVRNSSLDWRCRWCVEDELVDRAAFDLAGDVANAKLGRWVMPGSAVEQDRVGDLAITVAVGWSLARTLSSTPTRGERRNPVEGARRVVAVGEQLVA